MQTTVARVGLDTRHWIGGRRVESLGHSAPTPTFTDLSPIDERPIAEVSRGGEADVAAAVSAAGQAFARWAATPPPERAALLHAIADGIEARIEDLAQVETADNGALLRSHRRSVMPRVAHNFRFFADWLAKLDGSGMEINGHREQVSWAPSGVTAVITPWNAPLMLATWRIAPALAAGNTVVLKPPEWAPLTASLLADITKQAGLPDGVFNVATMFTGDEAKAERVSARLRAGTVWVNCFFVRDLRAPFGGAGLSGIGREGGTWSFDFYCDVKNTVYAGGRGG